MDQKSYEAKIASLQAAKKNVQPGSQAYKVIEDQIQAAAEDYKASTSADGSNNDKGAPAPSQANSDNVVVQSASKTNAGGGPGFGMGGVGAETYQDIGETSVLNKYNSYNYVWTLFVANIDRAKDPLYLFSNPEPENIILRTSGKGSVSLSHPSSMNAGTTGNANSAEFQEFLDGYLASSIGKFDFYIDNIDLSSEMTASGNSLITNGTMTIVEPLSMMGFVEAVKAMSYAAGYADSKGATAQLKLEFFGWKMNDAGEMIAEQVPGAVRLLPISLNQIDIEAGDRGTIYKIVFTGIGTYGSTFEGRTLAPIKMVGSNVLEVLDSFKRTLNDNIQRAQGSDTSAVCTEYDIEFAPWTTPDGKIDDSKNPIAFWQSVAINELHRSSQEFIFPNHDADTGKNAYKTKEAKKSPDLISTTETIQFRESEKIADCITAVIRESTFIKTWVFDRIEEYKNSGTGLVPYFRVFSQVYVKEPLNKQTGNAAYKITYTVMPYWIHHSRFPLEGLQSFDSEPLRRLCRRQYNYLYSGKNVDVLDFKFNYNNLYFQTIPFAMGNKDQVAKSTNASPTGSITLKVTEQDLKDPNRNPDGGQRQGVDPSLTSGNGNQPSGIKPQASPYQQLSWAIHNTLMNLQQDQSCILRIIGDPYYICTSGMGNGFDKVDEAKPGQTEGGEADILRREVYIYVQFQTPRDTNSDPTSENFGFMDFGQDLLPFTGIFKVRQARHIFRDGAFIQELELIRLSGQVVSKDPVRALATKSAPKDNDQVTEDKADPSIAKSGHKTPTASLAKMLTVAPGWGMPDLMGKLSAGLASAQGTIAKGIGAVGNSLSTTVARVDENIATALSPLNAGLQFAGQAAILATQIGGMVAVADALLSGSGSGQTAGQTVTGYDPLSNGIRLNTAGLSGANTTAMTQADIAAQARIIQSVIADPNMIRTLNQNYQNNVFSQGINYNTQPSNPTNLNNIGQKTTSVINGTPADPTAIANQLGINPAELTGLNAGKQSDILGKLLLVASLLPTESNLQGLQSLGMSLDNLYASTVAKLPSLAPLTTSPDAKTSDYDQQKIISEGGNPANLPGALNIASIAMLVALMGHKSGGSVSNSLSNTAASDKLQSSKDMESTLLSLDSKLYPAQLGLGSQETNQETITSVVQGYGGVYQTTKTVNKVYGTQKGLSPLDIFMTGKKLNG